MVEVDQIQEMNQVLIVVQEMDPNQAQVMGQNQVLVVEVAPVLNQEVGLDQVLVVKQEVVLEQRQEVEMKKLQLNKKKKRTVMFSFSIYII